MDPSYAQTVEFTCPDCNRAFSAQVWLIVDVVGRPGLLARVRAGVLHMLICPRCCEIVGQLDAPLLLYRPGQEPPLIFSPAQSTTDEQDQQHFSALVELLQGALGEAWQDAWAETLPSVPRQLLPEVVATDPQVDRG